jgi:hypothetical protein
LAWESGADGVDWSIDLILCQLGHIVKARHFSPVFRQDSAAKRVDLAKRDNLKSASHFSAQIKTADARKKRQGA